MTKKLSETNFIEAVAERDIDLLILEELHVSPEFQAWLATKLFGNGVDLNEWLGAWHSISDANLGESDLILCFRDGGGRVCAGLLENKIAAQFMERQAERYQERGKQGIEEGNRDVFRTCLIAPEAYLEGAADEPFDVTLAYEELSEWFIGTGLGARGEYKARILREAIEQGRRGYKLNEDERVTLFWQDYWESLGSECPQFVMARPGKRGAGSAWPEFRHSSFSKGDKLTHKLDTGWVELCLAGDTAERLEGTFGAAIDDDMAVHQHKNTAVIRIKVPEVDRFAEFSTQRESVQVAWSAADRLVVLRRDQTRG